MFLTYNIFSYELIVCLTIFQKLSASTNCNINWRNEFAKSSSMIILSLNEHGVPSYVYPTIKDPENIIIPAGETFEVFCPGQTDRKSTEIIKPGALQIYNTKLQPNRSIETVECVNNNEFKVNNYTNEKTKNIVQMKDISCMKTSDKKFHSVILRKVNQKCGTAERYQIGYDLGDDNFLETADLCHDKSGAKTLWAHSLIIPVNQDEFREKGPRKKFRIGQLFEGVDITSKQGPYKLKRQFQYFLRLFDNDKEKAKMYASESINDNKFLARGHLIARADKLYRTEQDSLDYFANVVPMWQQINAKGGNWFFVEEYIRRLAFQKNRELDIWAGGIGTLEVEYKSDQTDNKENELKPPSINVKLVVLDGKIPVPRVLFKCAVDKKLEEALCFLVVNNPYLSKTQVEDSKDKYIVCKKYNICKEIRSDYNNPESGIFYCCKLGDFYEKLHEELGLDDLEVFKKYKALTLFTKEQTIPDPDGNRYTYNVTQEDSS